MNFLHQAINGILILVLTCATLSQTAFAQQREDVLKPYNGPSVKGADPNTLKGKIMTGYQGWFNCPGDGANLGWGSWGTSRGRRFEPGKLSIDLWPDVSEYDDDELYVTPFFHADGTPAKVFSSHNRKTVIRHFKWMRDYGIDGAFVQRFSHNLDNSTQRYHKDKVLSNAREGANRYGRTYAVMYDITSMPDDEIITVFDDWKMLCDTMHITEDPAYQHHNGKPLVTIWGVGFNNIIKKRAGLGVCKELIQKFKANGYSVMLGIPTGWRAQDFDALDDPQLHKVLLMADVLSPWAVGRFNDMPELKEHAEKYWQKDVPWAKEHKIDYMPVVFPGFSRHNMKGDKLDKIPRLDGQFLWSQVVANKKAGADMLYIAMFDEVDEGTAIFKCSNNPPTSGGAKFVTFNGLPSDFYLQLAGKAGKLFRGEIPLAETIPIMTNDSQKDNTPGAEPNSTACVLPINGSDWKITFPVEGQNGSALEILNPDFSQYLNHDCTLPDDLNRYFYLTREGLAFFAEYTGVTTSSRTKYSRTELREMRGSKEGNWTLSEGGALNARLKVENLKGSANKIIFMQIHGKAPESKPLLKCIWEKGWIRFLTKSGEKLNDYSRQNKYVEIGLNEWFSCSVKADRKSLRIQINGITVESFGSEVLDFWPENNTYYFKAGNYLQDDRAGTGATVIFSSVSVSHSTNGT